jgi:hypothetical protein
MRIFSRKAKARCNKPERGIGASLPIVLLLVFNATSALASHDVGVGGFVVQRKTAQADEQLAEADSVSIAMRCFASEDGHRLTIVASSLEKTKRLCQSRCYYRTSSGLDGLMYAGAIVTAGLDNGELRTDFFKDFSISVTNPGSFSCQ